MVARIVSGKSIRGILNYNENKIERAEAKLLMASGYVIDQEALSFKDKLERFEMRTRQNLMTKTNALHITLNFSPREHIDDHVMEAIALEYMNGIGFGNQPFLAYRHYDAAHPHIHIATVNIADGGQRIETHNIGRNQSERARKEIEVRYGLVKAEDQQKEMAYLLRPAKLTKAIYGKSETKAAISSIVREVTDTYKFTSFGELSAALRQFNVLADRGEEGTAMRENGGLTYHILDEAGQKAGVPIKASSIYSAPTLKNIEKKYGPNKEARKPYSQRLKHLLDKAIRASNDMETLQTALRKQGIRILLRYNVQEEVYGATFIDNGTKSVFNGSDLGKAYSAKALMDRLSTLGYSAEKTETSKPKTKPESMGKTSGEQVPQNTSGPELKEKYPAQEQSVIEAIWDIALSDRYEETTPNPFRKKRKKLGFE